MCWRDSTSQAAGMPRTPRRSGATRRTGSRLRLPSASSRSTRADGGGSSRSRSPCGEHGFSEPRGRRSGRSRTGKRSATARRWNVSATAATRGPPAWRPGETRFRSSCRPTRHRERRQFDRLRRARPQARVARSGIPSFGVTSRRSRVGRPASPDPSVGACGRARAQKREPAPCPASHEIQSSPCRRINDGGISGRVANGTLVHCSRGFT